MTTRRYVLNAGFFAAAAILAGGPRAAFAFRIEEDGESPRARLLLSACETRNAHEKLIAELLADLEPTQGQEKAAETVRGMDCPLCGCRLGLAMPAEPSAPRF
ncbi:MAG: hypothetical protein JNK67_10290 [Alphaproteobacteria bacterium]|nr:hypothetical protein [Alphaproteobacteria bacterium]